ncbi:uncharacterized protein LOC135701954 [Ochlerotatus camptorhynchus]|uniref:uncharacterized protein LOC135701954 n=1 Tax=Ochlerotatus camptorhynchus TaxID=644619 RepID=UPI0031D39D87
MKEVQDMDGRRYIELGYDCYAELQTNPSPEVEGHLNGELELIKIRLDGIETKLEKLVLFMANIDKLMSTKKSGSTAPEKKGNQECFLEFADLCPVQDENRLKLLEKNLNDRMYTDKLYRFFHTEYSLNGKREGSPFFKTIMRRMLVPTILLPFSWKGFSRKVPGPESTADNRSFKETFPGFVAFIQRIVCAADIAHTVEANDACFSQFLRQKNVEVQRFLEGKQGRWANCTRQRKCFSKDVAKRSKESVRTDVSIYRYPPCSTPIATLPKTPLSPLSVLYRLLSECSTHCPPPGDADRDHSGDSTYCFR